MKELIVDSFAGGGGASTGIELATGQSVDIAINHDPDAILMHKTNHPDTTHYQTNIWDVNPEEVCGGTPVGLLWASPDCKHFSKAKGGKPVDRNIRGLAWIVLRWAGTVRPRVIILENVEEFQTWGPVRRGRPIKAKSGETFRKFVKQLETLGYIVEWRELVAADYGAPTTRKRFFLIARCDSKPIVWPEHIYDRHGACGLPKWRSAAEIIDWSLPLPSIFDTREQIREKYGLIVQRPLRPNTTKRVIRGLDKFVIKSARPFIIPIGYGERAGQAPRIHDINYPLPTSVGVVKHGIATPVLIQYHSEQSEPVRGQEVTRPLMTIDGSNRYALIAACLTKYYSGDHHGQDINVPLHTITTKDREALLTAHMVKLKGTNLGSSADEPLQTITSGGLHHGLVATSFVKAEDSAELRHWPEILALLNEHCGYQMADNEILLLQIGEGRYFIADIGLRMLSPRELYRANGFPDDYIIDHDYSGNEYPKSKQVARCGNAVPPPFAEALVRANFPEWCEEKTI